MIFLETKLRGAFVIQLEKMEDQRGFFARAWCRKEFEEHGLNSDLAQANIAFSRKKGTLRGMHYQVSPYQEAKSVRCINGAIFDVAIDLRPESSTYKDWIGVELTADNYKMLYVPENFAHGYQTLTENTGVFYQVSQFYSPDHERGISWNDPLFGIQWPIADDVVISEKDHSWPDYVPQR
jgi:dTDP-4-dehydrorhamnose 3,5-epimerase